ncbi:helix-turn-helix domain-containing protein [Streptomyces sp. NBC_00649]|uniref:helix-turn-helix domain-containing protein n=1 Tax=Streptomyces sp. NBC_00649 TaxID=2975798 RepID=UPI0038688661
MRRRDEEEPLEPGWLTWLKGTLIEREYDVKSPRGGGRAKLAKETGLAASTVTRILSGQVPDFENQVILARHLGVPLSEFLIRTGKATEADFPYPSNESSHIDVSSQQSLTPEELAALAGVPEADKDWFTTMVRSLRRRGPTDNGNAAGGAAAEG